LKPPADISIVIATYDRPGSLAICLESLLVQQTTRSFEIVVVDNHPQSGKVRELMPRFPTVRFLEERAAGVSQARNHGIRNTASPIIVSTDDDVVAPPEWLETLTEPLFAHTHLAGTTGNCLPLKTEFPSEILYEAYGGLRHGDQPADFDLRWMNSWRFYIPPLWLTGTTANAAFRREALVALGGFEPLLGAGAPAGAWEDLYLCYLILSGGGVLRYVPAAELRHAHRESMEALTRQLKGYRRGEGAFLTLLWRRHRDWRVFGQALYWIPKWRLSQVIGELRHRLSGSSVFPLWLIAAECRAYFDGPAAIPRDVSGPSGLAPLSEERLEK
jgi:O-antigen biosynthesis protein